MKRLLLLWCSVMSLGAFSLTKSTPLSSASIPSKTFRLSESLPDARDLPEQSAVIKGARYVVIQSKGGSLFLGPLLGGLSISSKTNALAEHLKGSYVDVDPLAIAKQAADGRTILAPDPAEAGIDIKPFVFLQSCYDGKYRLSLVFHLDQASAVKDRWVGRYTYHLPITLTEEQLSHPSPEAVEAYRSEMAQGAKKLYEILEKDLKGDLSSEDQPLKLGALHLVGSKMAWEAPEKISFSNFYLLEEREGEIVVRRQKALLDGTVQFGGLTFGVHLIRKNMVHTFELLKNK